MHLENSSINALTPKETAIKTATIGIEKANKAFLPQWLLGMLAGMYIGFGAMLYTMVKSDHSLGFMSTQLLSGLVFSLGLILVVVAGAELFTGNNLLTIAWAQRKITTKALLRNWALIIVANFAGAALLALMVYASGHPQMNDGHIAEAYVKVANAKCELPFWTAFFRGILCNILVCLGVWLGYAGRSLTDKVLGILFPVMGFVAAGFEHSIANMYILVMGALNKGDVTIPADSLTLMGSLHNIVPVLLGNAIGGGIFVGIVYWAIYLRNSKNL